MFKQELPQFRCGLHRLSLHDPILKKYRHVNDLWFLERHIAAVSDFQQGEFFCCLHQFSGTAGRYFLIPAVPVVRLITGSEFEQHMSLWHELGITAELTAYGVVGFALAENRLRHVRFHFVEALAEPAFGIIEAANHTVVQNAVKVFLFRQVIDRGRSWDFFVCHII